MKNIIAAIAFLIASSMSASAGEATASTAPQLDRTQEYRMWSAERLIERLLVRVDKVAAACGKPMMQTYLPRYSEACKESMIKLYPALSIIREVAAGGDDVKWAKAIDIAHRFETDTEMPLAVLESAR